MKISILSMQQVNNMGSLLQAYALKKIVSKYGYDIGFLDIVKNETDNSVVNGTQLNFENEAGNNANTKLLMRKCNYFFVRLLNKHKWKRQISLFELFRLDYIPTDNSTFYDVCIIGSDEVFNCLDSGRFGFTSQLFGNVNNVHKVITYAASCGATKYDMLNNDVKNIIKKSFEKVSAFSVRDNNTKEFVSKLTKKEIATNLDPVLIYDFSQEMETAVNPIKKKNYCVIYSYYNRIHTKEEIAAIRLFCKKNNLKTIAVGGPQYWCDLFVPCSPFQCLKIFEESSFVITDTFHGTIFSAKYAKKFAVIARESNKNKLLDLVSRLELKKHLIQKIEELHYNHNNFINDFDKTGRLLEEERKKTFRYLEEELNGK